MYLNGQRIMRVIGFLIITLFCPLAAAEAATSDPSASSNEKLIASTDKAPHLFSLAAAEELNDKSAASAVPDDSDKESARMLIFLLGSLALSLIILSRDRSTEPTK
ncbi:MAG: hypothetical protein AAF542_24025 [Pseudomonadota bacterium]